LISGATYVITCGDDGVVYDLVQVTIA